MKAPWSHPVEVRRPDLKRAHWMMGNGFRPPHFRSSDVTLTPFFGQLNPTTVAGWSWRFSPTESLSQITSMPISFKCFPGPIPLHIRICGEPMAPPVTRTSPPSFNVALKFCIMDQFTITVGFLEATRSMPYLRCVVTHNVVCNPGGGLGSIEINLSDHGPTSDNDILSLLGHVKEGGSSGASLTFVLGNLEAANSILRSGPVVEIIIGSQSSSNSNLKEPLTEWILVTNILHYPLTFLPVELRIATSHILLGLFEVRKHISGRPSWDTPSIVVLRGSTVVKAHICARRSSKNLDRGISMLARLKYGPAIDKNTEIRKPKTHLSSLQKDISSVTGLFSFRFKLPIVNTTEQSKNTGRDTDESVIIIRAASLQYKDTFSSIGGKTVSQNASSKSTSSDNVVIWLVYN